jgi:hypothetical protein
LERSPKSSRARQLAETFSASVRQSWEAEDDALRLEFANLDLTEEESADLHEAFRLRRLGASRADQRASRAVFNAVRRSLAEALKATIEFETRNDRVIRALAVFDRDEAQTLERLEVALIRPQSDAELAALHRRIASLEATRDARRSAIVRDIGLAGDVSTMPRSDALRIDSRDGLATLHDRGKVTLRQALAGYAYRRRWERAFAGLRSALASGGGTNSPLKIAAAQERSAQWELQRSRCDTAVTLRMRSTPNALMLLRRVAGEGASVTSVAGNGRAHDRAVSVLCGALDVVADVLPYEDN